MTLSELAEAVGAPGRQIRFMIAEGVLPPAVKTGRSADAYNEEHLVKARRYMILHGLGMKPAAIKVLMAFDEAIPIYQSTGIELRVDASIDPTSIDIDSTLKEMSKALLNYTRKR